MPWVKTKDMFFSALFKVTQISPTVQFVKKSKSKQKQVHFIKEMETYTRKAMLYTYIHIYIYIYNVYRTSRTNSPHGWPGSHLENSGS